MALNQSDQDIAEERRRKVAALRRQRLTHRGIALALERAGERNPKTGEPWSYITVKNDLDFLKAQNRAEALKETAEHKAEILADYHEILRRCWATSPPNLELARKTLGDMRALLGTDAPQVIIYEQVQRQLLEGLERLTARYGHDPELLDGILAALSGEPEASGAARDLN